MGRGRIVSTHPLVTDPGDRRGLAVCVNDSTSIRKSDGASHYGTSRIEGLYAYSSVLWDGRGVVRHSGAMDPGRLGTSMCFGRAHPFTSQTGDEYDDTRRDVELHILPLLAKHGIRYVQVARRGHLERQGITVLSDTSQPERLFIEGDYKLSDELRPAGTVPQFGGEHICSLKFKAWVIEQWLAKHLRGPIRHALGYSAEETRRVTKSEKANVRRVAFGYNAQETSRIEKAISYDTPARQSFYPLVDWGWTRQDCIDYHRETLGVLWKKSACVQCPFNALKEDGLERHRESIPNR